MDLESTQGHHRLLTKYTGEGREGRLPYLGVEARRKAAARRNPSSAGLDAWTGPKAKKGVLVFWRRRRRRWWCGGPRPWMVMARSS